MLFKNKSDAFCSSNLKLSFIKLASIKAQIYGQIISFSGIYCDSESLSSVELSTSTQSQQSPQHHARHLKNLDGVHGLADPVGRPAFVDHVRVGE